MRFDLFPDGFDGGVGPQEAVSEGLVFPQQTEQQVLRFDVGTAKLRSFITGDFFRPL